MIARLAGFRAAFRRSRRNFAVQLRRIWTAINEPLLDPQRYEIDKYSLTKIFTRYFLRPHWKSLLLVVVLIGIGGARQYVYAGANQYIVDDIIELDLTNPDADPEQQDTPDQAANAAAADPVPAAAVPASALPTGKTVSQKFSLLAEVAVFLIFMECVRLLFEWTAVARGIQITQKSLFRMRQNLHDKLHALPMTYHDHHSPGRLMTHLFSDAQVLSNNFVHLAQQIPPQIVSLITGLCVTFYLDTQLTFLLLLSLPAYGVTYRWIRTRLRHVARNVREREGRLNGMIANRISNFQVVKSFRRETAEAQDFLRAARPIIQGNLSRTVLRSGFQIACATITMTSLTAVLWLGALRVKDGVMSSGQLVNYYYAAATMFGPVAGLTMITSTLHQIRAVATKVVRVLDEPVTLTDPDHPIPPPESACQVRFESVTMRYQEDRPPALSDLSFTLDPGQRLCIMGPSGCGKSTIARLIARLYDPTEGVVSINGVNVRSYKMIDLRRFVGFVTQEPVVFSGTIGDNIRYGSERASMTEVVAAAQYAQIHGFITTLPERYQTLTYERGLTLSGGQKQRVSLARAILYDPKVLVLDDCTSALDADTEAKLIESFDEALLGRTAVIISHRASVALASDLVMMLDAGQQVQFGPPHDLLEVDGPFKRLYEQQSGAAWRPTGPDPSLRT